MKEERDDGIRKQKDLKVLVSHTYTGVTFMDFLHIQVMDRKTGKVYAGNIENTFNKLKDWEKEHKLK